MTLIGHTMMCEQAGPKQLAQEVATMQLLSDGRFTLGLGGKSQQHIAGGQWPHIGRSGEMLEARKLVERRRSPEDRRRHLVELTDVGAEQLAKAECALSAVEDEVLGALDESQRETLYSLLQQAAAGTVMTCTETIHD